MDYFTSDLHLGHDRDFIYKPRGFGSVTEMNETIIRNFSETLKDEDTLYILGDVMMGAGIKESCQMLGSIPGRKKIVIGNHDSQTKLELIKDIPGVEIIGYADVYEYRERKFFLSHYPTMTASFRMDLIPGKNIFTTPLKSQMINLSGHTHDKSKWDERTMSYNVAVDAHECYPVSIEDIVKDCRLKYAANSQFVIRKDD